MKKIIVCGMLALGLSGCGALNAYTATGLSAGAADYAGAKKNIQAADDLAIQAWVDAGCNLKLGALQRAPTAAVKAAFTACPLPNPTATLDAASAATIGR